MKWDRYVIVLQRQDGELVLQDIEDASRIRVQRTLERFDVDLLGVKNSARVVRRRARLAGDGRDRDRPREELKARHVDHLRKVDGHPRLRFSSRPSDLVGDLSTVVDFAIFTAIRRRVRARARTVAYRVRGSGSGTVRARPPVPFDRDTTRRHRTWRHTNCRRSRRRRGGCRPVPRDTHRGAA